MKPNHEICSMQILLIAATEPEIGPVIEARTGADILITGVGLPSALYHLQKRMHQIDYDLVIQAGIAGTYNSKLEPAQTVWVKQDAFGDLGMEEKEKFTPLFEAGFGGRDEFPFTNGWLMNPHELAAALSLPAVSSVTVNKVTDSKLQEQQIIRQFNPDIESMEGAALHYVCLQEQVPFIQLRSISNRVGERDKKKWTIKESIENLNKELLRFLNQ